MESTYKPGNLTCAEVREVLSDVLDARRGEIPHPDGSPLAASGFWPAVELHLAACEYCRRELETLHEVGAAFADFSVDEKPAQHFAGYGPRVRERLRMSGVAMPARRARFGAGLRRRHAWAAVGLSGLAAASVALAFFRNVNMPQSGQGEQVAALAPLEVPSEARRKMVMRPPASGRLPRIDVGMPTSDGVQTVSMDYPVDQASIQRLQQQEGRLGYLYFSVPLLGVVLKTTRDRDRVVGDDPVGLKVDRVVPGSPAYAMELRKGDFIVTLDDLAVSDGGTEEALKFISNISELGAGREFSIDAVRPVGSQYLFLKRKYGVLGHYEFAP